MADQEQISVSIRTTKVGWDHIIKLIQQDTDPAWSQFNAAFVNIIEDTVKRSTGTPATTVPQPQHYYEEDDNYDEDYGEDYYDEEDDSQEYGYYIGEDGKYHDEDYFNEEYGGYSNYLRLKEDANELGFPDVDSYRNWLDD